MHVKLYKGELETKRCGTPNTTIMRLKELDAQIAALQIERKRVIEACGVTAVPNGKIIQIEATTAWSLNKDYLLGEGKVKSSHDDRRGGKLVELVSENDWSNVWSGKPRAAHLRFKPSLLPLPSKKIA